eukprot:NODE_603_length_1567_cov_101.055336_g497_i0.p1 GENE.NODE_603_length_1567_cov_101.055336_g497_i0~~NODE_603_length_1567_cov_101.055336_g497_i0.p1  ORF type:complete len:484 (+),score=120.95 NODE_603_length_1567_cov_101.055336_g497_i0:43-1452(+)
MVLTLRRAVQSLETDIPSRSARNAVTQTIAPSALQFLRQAADEMDRMSNLAIAMQAWIQGHSCSHAKDVMLPELHLRIQRLEDAGRSPTPTPAPIPEELRALQEELESLNEQASQIDAARERLQETLSVREAALVLLHQEMLESSSARVRAEHEVRLQQERALQAEQRAVEQEERIGILARKAGDLERANRRLRERSRGCLGAEEAAVLRSDLARAREEAQEAQRELAKALEGRSAAESNTVEGEDLRRSRQLRVLFRRLQRVRESTGAQRVASLKRENDRLQEAVQGAELEAAAWRGRAQAGSEAPAACEVPNKVAHQVGTQTDEDASVAELSRELATLLIQHDEDQQTIADHVRQQASELLQHHEIRLQLESRIESLRRERDMYFTASLPRATHTPLPSETASESSLMSESLSLRDRSQSWTPRPASALGRRARGRRAGPPPPDTPSNTTDELDSPDRTTPSSFGKH